MLMRNIEFKNRELIELVNDLKNDINSIIENHSEHLLDVLEKKIFKNSPDGRRADNKESVYKTSPHYDILPGLECIKENSNLYDPCGRDYLEYMINLSENKIITYDESEWCGWPNKELFLNLTDLSGSQQLKEYNLKEKADKITYGWLNGNSRALFGLYPPNGYIPWHNNGNAPGYNILMHYSWGGDGGFHSYHNGEIIDYPDKDNEWIARAGRFESTEGTGMVGDDTISVSQKDASWHCADTKCWRLTVSTIINNKDIWEDVIEEMESVDL